MSVLFADLLEYAGTGEEVCMVKQRGFTLAEVLIVVVIMTILMSIAAPGFLDFLRTSQAMGAVNEFVSDINMARTEAIRKRSRVVVCSRQTDSACGGASDWANGYLVFVDADSDGVFDAGEVLVKVVQSPGSRITLALTATATGSAVSNLIFRPSGGVPTATSAVICMGSGLPGKRATVSLAGQILVANLTCP